MTEEKKSSTKYVMVESGPSVDEDEIDLLELIRTLLQAWKTIAGITIVCIVMSVGYALRVPVVFEAETLLAPATEGKSSASSALSQFGGLASLAGISMPSSSNTQKTLAILNTRVFLKNFVTQKKILPEIFSDYWDRSSNSWVLQDGQDAFEAEDAVEVLRNAITTEKASGLIRLTLKWNDSVIAAEWANDLVKQLNEQLRLKAISDSQKRVGYLEQELAKTTLQDMRTVLYSLLEYEKQKAMLANVNEDFALIVIDPAVAPEIHSKPNRKLIVALGGVCGSFLGIFAVFFAQFLGKLKSSSEKVH
jgi:uncharacterized protein involved in exopolysaccharide biosynthesis